MEENNEEIVTDDIFSEYSEEKTYNPLIPTNWSEASKEAAEYFGLDLVDENQAGKTVIRFPKITITANNDTGSEIIEDLYVMFEKDRVYLKGFRIKFTDRHLTNMRFDHSHLSSENTFCLGSSSFKLFWIDLRELQEVTRFDWIIFFSELQSYLQVENHIGGSPYKNLISIDTQHSSSVSLHLDTIRQLIFSKYKNHILFDEYNIKNIKLDNSFDFWHNLSIDYCDFLNWDLSKITQLIGSYSSEKGYGLPISLEENKNRVVVYSPNYLPNYTVHFKGQALTPYYVAHKKEDETFVTEISDSLKNILYFTKTQKIKIQSHIVSHLQSQARKYYLWKIY